MVRNGLTLAGYIALLIRFSAWMALAVLVATMPAFIAEARFSGAAFRLRNWRSPDSRRLTYLEYVLANDEHAKEVKLFGLGPLLLGRYRTLAETFFADDRRLAVRRAGWGYALSLLSTAVFYGCYAMIVATTVRGRLSLGDMTLYLVAFRQGQQSFQAVLSALGGMYEDTLYMSNLFDYFAIPTDAPKVDRADRRSCAPRRGFASKGSASATRASAPTANAGRLRDVEPLHPQGAEPGAGRRERRRQDHLHQAAGRTSISRPRGACCSTGATCAAGTRRELRRRIGVIFQDFNEYQLALRENVAFGSVDHLRRRAARGARGRSAAAPQELVAGLAGGLETQLGRWFGGGVELSGGQWQKVALARAFMREEADILILDEPTAALDAEAEHAVFQRFRALAAGRTTILISHRFPTVRMADRILVLEAGRVIEDGTHAELVAAGRATPACSGCRRPVTSDLRRGADRRPAHRQIEPHPSMSRPRRTRPVSRVCGLSGSGWYREAWTSRNRRSSPVVAIEAGAARDLQGLVDGLSSAAPMMPRRVSISDVVSGPGLAVAAICTMSAWTMRAVTSSRSISPMTSGRTGSVFRRAASLSARSRARLGRPEVGAVDDRKRDQHDGVHERMPLPGGAAPPGGRLGDEDALERDVVRAGSAHAQRPSRCRGSSRPPP